jgi:hypothetical protein
LPHAEVHASNIADATHEVKARLDHYETVGRFLLGLDSESSFV